MIGNGYVSHTFNDVHFGLRGAVYERSAAKKHICPNASLDTAVTALDRALSAALTLFTAIAPNLALAIVECVRSDTARRSFCSNRFFSPSRPLFKVEI